MSSLQDKIGAGRTATIFRYGHNRVIKLFRPNFPRHAIDEEFKIGRCLNSIGLNIPITHDLIEIENSKGILLDFIEGRSMLQNLASKPWMVSRYARKMAHLHLSIHNVSFLQSNCINSLKQLLNEKISKVDLLTVEEKASILSYLSSTPDGSALCHGDFHPDNIIMSKDRLVTVDWITASIGNPVADVARTWLLLMMGTLPEDKSRLEIYLAKHLREWFSNTYLKEYLTLSKVPYSEFESWKLPVAAARLVENVSMQENQNLLTLIRMKLRALKT